MFRFIAIISVAYLVISDRIPEISIPMPAPEVLGAIVIALLAWPTLRRMLD